jgi:hypothetical protein
MKTIYTIICLLYMVSCINADVWVVSQKGLSDDRQPKKVVWVVTQKPSKVSKVCSCSKECVCGCNRGKECDCDKPKPQSQYRIVTPAEAWSCTVGNG